MILSITGYKVNLSELRYNYIMQLAFLGRQPKISLAELESIYGADRVHELTAHAAKIDLSEPINQSRLGGTIKSSEILAQIDSHDVKDVFQYLQTNITNLVTKFTPTGKINFGISCYEFEINYHTLLKQTLTIKNLVKESGRNLRIIENKSSQLSTAQLLYNKLASRGIEINIVKTKAGFVVSRTNTIQNIDDYSKRDFGRPKRDARVGMLPPKLAQIIINLTGPQQDMRILDPFCGTGVILQEALLMGFDALGSDIESRMVEYSSVNLEWLSNKYQLSASYFAEQADATNHTWTTNFDLIACETYLGRPFSTPPKPEILQKVMQDVDTIHRKFLQNIAKQTKKDFKMCIAVPAWSTPNGYKHLKVLDSLEDLGYTRQVFKHASNQDLVYHRPDQIVARELVILIRK